MKQKIRQFLAFLIKIFWTRPTDKPEPFKATEVSHIYTCIKYKGQWVNLRKTEVEAFEAMARSDKRAMAQRFAVMVKKRQVKFMEINGVMTCVKNKDYGSKADARQ